MGQRHWASWSHSHGSLDPAQYASLALTHVKYHPDDPLAMPLSMITLAPPFLIVTYVAILLVRRELTIGIAFFGQLACEGLNLILKRIFKQGRPTDFLGTGYGMPSSHSQFVGYFMAFWCAHLLRYRPGMSRALRRAEAQRRTGAGGSTSVQRGRSLIDVIRSLEHAALLAMIVCGSVLTAYSRYHLSYHTPLQIFVGFSLGLACGGAWYGMAEVLGRRAGVLRSFGGVQRSPRRALLENPLFVALRVRDSWAVWDDGGVEAEYGLWRAQWDRLQSEQDLSSARIASSSSAGVDVDRMLLALRLASQCDKTTTAFSVGCVVSDSQTGRILATGFSREEPGNTHAEEVALNKLAASAVKADDGAVPQALTLYTTMEPCSQRLSKKDACVQRILAFNAVQLAAEGDARSSGHDGQLRNRRPARRMVVERIVQGVQEPDDFVQCEGTRLLHDSGLQVVNLSSTLSSSITLTSHGKNTTTITLEPGWIAREATRLAKHGHEDQPRVQNGEDLAWRQDGWPWHLAWEEFRKSQGEGGAREGRKAQ